MIWIDYIIIAIIAISTVISLIKGFVQQLVSLASWLLAFFLALRFAPDFGQYLEQYIALAPARQGIAFFVIFFAVVIIGSIIGVIASKIISVAHLSLGDRFLGMLFGVVRGVVIVLTLTFFLGMSPLVEEPWWDQSMLLAHSRELLVIVLDWMPENFSQALFDRLKAI